MLYANETFRQLEPGMKLEAWVKRVRPDGKIDLRLAPAGSGRLRSKAVSEEIVRLLYESPNNILTISDRSTPEEIKSIFQCSKRDFKQAVGHLLKSGKIAITPTQITLLKT